MSHDGFEKKRVTSLRGWKSGRGGFRWDRGSSAVGRSFDEDLALFERQVREEAGERTGGPAVPAPRGALSA